MGSTGETMWMHALAHHYRKVHGDFPNPHWTIDDAIRFGGLLLIDGEIRSVRQMGKKGRAWLADQVMKRIDIVEMTDEDYETWKASVNDQIGDAVALAKSGDPGKVSPAERRRHQIVEARDAGELLTDIARRLGVTTEYVRHIYHAELKRRERLKDDATTDDSAGFATPRTPSGVVDRNDRT